MAGDMVFALAMLILNAVLALLGRKTPLFILAAVYPLLLAAAFLRPEPLAQGIMGAGADVLPGPCVASVLALLSVEMIVLLRIKDSRLEKTSGTPNCLKYFVAYYGVFLILCVAAVVLMFVFDINLGTAEPFWMTIFSGK